MFSETKQNVKNHETKQKHPRLGSIDLTRMFKDMDLRAQKCS